LVLNDVRNKHFVASSIKDVFDNIEAQKIIDFMALNSLFCADVPLRNYSLTGSLVVAGSRL